MSKVEIEIPDDRWFRGEWEIRPQDKQLCVVITNIGNRNPLICQWRWERENMRRNLQKYAVNMRLKSNSKRKCSGTIFTMIMVFFIITFIVTVGEFYRIHILQQDIEYQLQRSVNCAVEFAMGDSYRQDKIINLDVALAKREFYKYLYEDVGLDSSFRKFKNGKMTYRLYFSSVSGSKTPAELTVEGRAEAESLFSFLTGAKIKIPFNISSSNYRMD